MANAKITDLEKQTLPFDDSSLLVVETPDGTKSLSIKNLTAGVLERNKIACTFIASGWSDTLPYTQAITVGGITESLNPIIDVIISDDVETGKREQRAYSYITKVTTGEKTLTAYCYETKPDVDLNIMLGVI